MNNLGGCYLLDGDLTKAEELYRQSIILRRVARDRRGAANTLNNLELVFAQKAKPETLAKITGDINTLTGELEAAQAKIRRDNPRYADLTQGATLSTREIQAMLDDETILLEYKLGDARSFLWLVSKDAVKIYTLPARAEIEKTARSFYDAITSHVEKRENAGKNHRRFRRPDF